MERFRNSKLVFPVFILITILCFLAASNWGGGKNGKAAEGNTKETYAKETDVSVEEEEESSSPAQSLSPEEEAKRELPLSEAERALLVKLYASMRPETLSEAARLLNDNAEAFRVLTEETLCGEIYLFGETGDASADGLNGDGLVLTKYNTAFFGDFRDGMPEGKLLAIQAVVLDFPRFTFAVGEWKNGKMNGAGSVGYHYYDGKPEGDFLSVKKSGTFSENLMEGDVRYQADSGEARVLSWELQAQAGVTVLDERWTYYSYSGEYMLESENDADRAYVISEETKDAVRWNNLILWDVPGQAGN